MKLPTINLKFVTRTCLVAWLLTFLLPALFALLFDPLVHNSATYHITGAIMTAVMWAAYLLTLLSLVLAFRSKNGREKSGFNPRILVFITIAVWGLILASFVLPGLGFASLSILVLFALVIPLTIMSLIVLVAGYSNQPVKEEGSTNGRVAKIVSSALVISVVTSVISAITSLSIDVYDMAHNKFVYENLATGALFAAIALTFILSSLQKDIYWVSSRQKLLRLDERQIKERQQIFEKSYKIGAVLVLATILFFMDYANNVIGILARDGNTLEAMNNAGTQFVAMPNHTYLPLLNLVVTLFALPLIIAAWKKR